MIESYEEDLEYLFNKSRELQKEIEEIKEQLKDQQAETADYIRQMTDRKYEAYRKLLEVQKTDIKQKEIAEELEMDEAVLSRFKKEFKQNNIL